MKIATGMLDDDVDVEARLPLTVQQIGGISIIKGWSSVCAFRASKVKCTATLNTKIAGRQKVVAAMADLKKKTTDVFNMATEVTGMLDSKAVEAAEMLVADYKKQAMGMYEQHIDDFVKAIDKCYEASQAPKLNFGDVPEKATNEMYMNIVNSEAAATLKKAWDVLKFFKSKDGKPGDFAEALGLDKDDEVMSPFIQIIEDKETEMQQATSQVCNMVVARAAHRMLKPQESRAEAIRQAKETVEVLGGILECRLGLMT